MDRNVLKTFNVSAPEILFGLGTIEELDKRVRKLGAERVLVVTDAGVAAAGIHLFAEGAVGSLALGGAGQDAVSRAC